MEFFAGFLTLVGWGLAIVLGAVLIRDMLWQVVRKVSTDRVLSNADNLFRRFDVTSGRSVARLADLLCVVRRALRARLGWVDKLRRRNVSTPGFGPVLSFPVGAASLELAAEPQFGAVARAYVQIIDDTDAALSRYARMIRHVRIRGYSQICPNSTEAHATLAIANLFELAAMAKLPVRVVTGRLKYDVYSGVSDAATAALQSGCNVQIIALCNASEIDDNQFARLITDGGGTIICLGPPESKLPHFILVGDAAYRYEIDIERKQALVCFNDKKMTITKPLREIFDGLWFQEEIKDKSH